MQYLIIAYDGKDAQATERRMAVRNEHFRVAERMHREGKAIIGGAILGDKDNMVGSARIVNFETRAELEEWLKIEPYVTGKVWETIQILPFRVAEVYKRKDISALAPE